METRTASIEMLDEVTSDMRLDYRGGPSYKGDDRYPEIARPRIAPFHRD